MARSLGLLYLVGPWLVLAWLLLPHPPGADVVGIVAIVIGSEICGAVLVSGAFDRRPAWFFQAIVALATVLISLAVYLAHVPNSGLGLLYLWSAPYAFAFFSRRHALLQTAFLGICYAAALGAQAASGDASGPPSELQFGQWLLAVGTVGAVGLLVRRLTESLRASDNRFRRGFEDSSIAMALVTLDGRFIEVNDALCRLLGRTRGQLLSLTMLAVSHPDDLELTRAALHSALDQRQRFEKRCLRPDGEVVWSTIDASLVDDARRPCYVVQAQDITARRAVEQHLERRARQQSALADLGSHGLRERHLDRFLELVAATTASTLDAEFCEVMELSADGETLRLVAGSGWDVDVVPRSAMATDRRHQAGYAVGAAGPVVVADFDEDAGFELPTRHRDHGVASGISMPVAGRARPWGVIGAHCSCPREFTPDEVAFLVSAADVVATAVARHVADERLRHQALHDDLTGLPNRTLLLDRLRHSLARRRGGPTRVAVLLLDIDHFKVVNDSLGHRVGDQLLAAIAPRLIDAVRPSDTVGRLGGDEFCVICEDITGARDAIEIAERIAAAVSKLVVLEGGEHFVTASIGIAIAQSPGDGAEALVRDADAAMYRAKQRGRGRYELFDETLRERAVARLRTEADLRAALERDELRVHYQPVVDIAGGRITGLEALVRWEHPARGLLAPIDFIPTAEESGLIVRVGEHVLETACVDVAGWQRRFDPELQICVNVAAHQLANAAFPVQVADISRRAELAPGTLALEITESTLLEEADAPGTVLERLRDYGLRLILDDFGTGYSSLSYLKRFPLHALKIDRSFIVELATDPDDAAIVEAVIRMAQTLGLTVVAEGVETEDQVAWLCRLGCHRAQGFLFAKPMARDETEAYLAGRLRSRSATAG